MNNIIVKPRNETVDIVRGIAMLMVVLQHTISGTCVGYECSFLFKVVWTLQMPMFFIVSGYVTRYSSPLMTIGHLRGFLKKRTIAYLLPWVVWTFLVRGTIFGQSNFFDLKYLLWHMDTGYWFLVSLWSIVAIFGLSDWITNKFSPKSKRITIILHLIFVAIGMAGLGAIGLVMGISFLSIKLTLYYIPLFMAGYLYGQLQEKFMKWEISHRFVSITYAFALAVWLILIVRLNFYNTDMTVELVTLRYLASICGCIAIIGFASDVYMGGRPLILAGQYSLEIYLLHYLLLKPLPIGLPVEMMSLQGFITMAAEYVMTISMVAILIYVIRTNAALNKALFYKTAKPPVRSNS